MTTEQYIDLFIGVVLLLLGTAILGLFLAGCGIVTNDGKGRVAVGACDVIVGDELGHLPPRHGGPESKAMEGTGIECRVWRF